MREPWIVQTPDGGAVAVWVEGTGPPLVLVHGSMCDHTAFGPLTEALRDAVSIFALDRRGFGASEDDPGYTPTASSLTLRPWWTRSRSEPIGR